MQLVTKFFTLCSLKKEGIKQLFHFHIIVSIKCVCLLFQEEGHSDWVACVRFSPNTANPIIVSSSWDKKVKVFVFFMFRCLTYSYSYG